MSISVRPILTSEYSLLEDFLYNAIFVPPGVDYPPREVIFEKEIFVYIKDFGGRDDCGVVAEKDGKLIGAAWTRIIPAYGHIDNHIPKLAISVVPEYRGRGVGAMMMIYLFNLLRERGYKRTSLSVQKDNPAVRFYKRLGYKITDEKLDHAGHEDYIMIKELSADIFITKYIPEYFEQLLALIKREGKEWGSYWGSEGKHKYQKALDNSIVYLLFENQTLCGYARCRDDDGFGVYIYDLESPRV